MGCSVGTPLPCSCGSCKNPKFCESLFIRELLGFFVCKSILQKPTLLQRLLRSQKEVCHENRLCARVDSGTEFGLAASRSEEIRLQENLSGESIQHRAQTPGVSSDARSDPRG